MDSKFRNILYRPIERTDVSVFIKKSFFVTSIVLYLLRKCEIISIIIK